MDAKAKARRDREKRKRDLAWLREKRRREQKKLERMLNPRKFIFFGKQDHIEYADLRPFQKDDYNLRKAIIRYLTEQIKYLEGGGFLERPAQGLFWWGRRFEAKQALSEDPGRF